MNRMIHAVAVTLLAVILALGGCAAEKEENTVTEKSQQSTEKPDYEHAHAVDHEWSAIYNLPAGTYTLELGPVRETPSLTLLFLKEIPERRAEQDHLALHLRGRRSIKVAKGESFRIRDRGLYELAPESRKTKFFFDVTEGARYIIYAEHDVSIRIMDGRTVIKNEE